MSQLLRQEFAIANVGWTPPREADATNVDGLGEWRSEEEQVYDEPPVSQNLNQEPVDV